MKAFASLGLLALLAAPAAALAQNPPPGPPPGDRPARPPLNRADLDSLLDARIAAIQAGLKLTPEQEKLWPPVEQAARAWAADAIGRMEQRREARNQPQRPDFMQRLERRTEMVSNRAEHMRTLTTALKPLWASLDERQKRLLPILARPVGGPRVAWARGMRDGMGPMGPGMMERMRERMREHMGGMMPGGMGGPGRGGMGPGRGP